MAVNTKLNECTPFPLSEFKPGQRLNIRFAIGAGHHAYCPAEFVAIVKGRVQVRCLDGWAPEWYSCHRLEAKYPGRLATVMAKNCYLVGLAPKDKERHPFCHWFKNIKEPIQGYGEKLK